MVMSLLRFNFVLPGLDPATMSGQYKAGVEMAKYADEHGFFGVTFEEHHGADNGWSPSPLINSALVIGCTSTIRITVSAVLVPLNDPLRLAEDIAVLDLASGGRFTAVAGLGYKPSEYEARGQDWSKRGAAMDHALETLLKAWTGEPFEYEGRTVRITPKPMSPPQMLMFGGGRSKPAARRAARLGLFFQPAGNVQGLEAYYYAQCQEYGTNGFAVVPGDDTAFLYIAEDPDKAWADVGEYFLHEAQTYASWQTDDEHSAAYSAANTVDELRADGRYQVLTPDQAIARAREKGDMAVMLLHPLVGGMPPERGWESLTLYTEKVLPALT